MESLPCKHVVTVVAADGTSTTHRWNAVQIAEWFCAHGQVVPPHFAAQVSNTSALKMLKRHDKFIDELHGIVARPVEDGQHTFMLSPVSGRRPQTLMLAEASGRVASAIVAKHPSVTCDGCGRAIGNSVRYKCLMCADFDFCDACEQRNACAAVQHGMQPDSGGSGTPHVFAKLYDSAHFKFHC